LNPKHSTKKQIASALYRAKTKLKNTLTPNEYGFLQKQSELFNKGKDSYSFFKNNPSRKKEYNTIVNSVVNKSGTIDRRDPDVYIFGGIPASGKTSLRDRVKEKTVVIDSDYFKERLSDRYKSPHKKYPLIHSSLLHREADILVEKAIKKASAEKRDVIIDMTASNKEKIMMLAKHFKAKGYDVHFLGILAYPHESITKVVGRFLVKGRYVPPNYVAQKGNQTNTSILELYRSKVFDSTYLRR